MAAQESSFPAEGPSAAETGERLRRRRQELGLSGRELARRVSLSPSLISQIERGSTMPSVATLYAIVSELGLSLDELFSLHGKAMRRRSPRRRPTPWCARPSARASRWRRACTGSG